MTPMALKSVIAAAAMLPDVVELIADGITFVGDVVRLCVRVRSLVRSLCGRLNDQWRPPVTDGRPRQRLCRHAEPTQPDAN